jgi:hypothetical protein
LNHNRFPCIAKHHTPPSKITKSPPCSHGSLIDYLKRVGVILSNLLPVVPIDILNEVPSA